MNKFKLEFNLKGEREYVQGPDIFDACILKLEKYYGNLSYVNYSAHNWLKNNADLIIGKDFEVYNSKIKFSSKKGSFIGYIIDNNKSISKKIDYSEKFVRNNSIISGIEISLYNDTSLSLTELLVSMNKFFLQSLRLDGKWIVTKLEYSHWSEIGNYVNSELKIVLIKNLKNRLTKSAVLLNNVKIGYIYFSLN